MNNANKQKSGSDSWTQMMAKAHEAARGIDFKKQGRALVHGYVYVDGKGYFLFNDQWGWVKVDQNGAALKYAIALHLHARLLMAADARFIGPRKRHSFRPTWAGAYERAENAARARRAR